MDALVCNIDQLRAIRPTYEELCCLLFSCAGDEIPSMGEVKQIYSEQYNAQVFVGKFKTGSGKFRV